MLLFSEDGLTVRRTLCVQKPLGQKKPSASEDMFLSYILCEALLKTAGFLLSFALLRNSVSLLLITR